MSDKTDDIKPLSDQEMEMATQLVAHLKKTVDKAGNGAVDSTVFEANLPDGLTAKQVKGYHEYLKSFGAAAIHAVGTVETPLFAKNKDLQNADVEFDLLGRNKITIGYRRERTSVNPQDRDNPHVSKGYIDYNLELSAGNAKSGPIGRARQLVRRMADDAFSQ